MKILEKKNIGYIVYMLVLLILGILFFFFIGTSGYVLEKDSVIFLEKKGFFQYILYSEFLSICQYIFGSTSYLKFVNIIQGLFSLTVSFIMTEYLRKFYKLNYVCGGIIFICSFGPYAYSLPQYVSSHGIITEGLTFPLFYIWMLCTFQIYLKKKKIWFFPLLIVTLIMMCTRSQLTLFIIIWFVMMLEQIVHFFYYRINEKYKKKFVIISIFTGFFCVALGIRIFFLFIENNIYPQMTDAVAGRIMSTIEKSDQELFEGRDKDLFLGIYEETERMETRQCYFRTGIRKWEDIAKATNENTKMLATIIRPYYPEIEMEELNDVKGRMTYVLMLEHWDDYLNMTADLMLQSLVVSIFYHPEKVYVLGYILAILLYILAAISIVWSKKKYHIDNIYMVPMLITLLVIIVICVITNIIFMGLQRYVVYPFGCFYISLIILWSGLIRERKY